jgi:DNA (cytosine-5)-methyltransferase 1
MLTLVDFFCGAGGSSQGAAAVPGVGIRLAANHWARAIESHAANFPGTEHFRGDLHDADVARFPGGDLFWASPECPQWSQARGKQRDFDRQADLFGETLADEAADRSRALMWDVPRYLGAMKDRGRPVLAGVVENVTEVRKWVHWQEWAASIRNLGYRTRLIALNSMHARPAVTPAAPQSRDRLYFAYWAVSLGRDPDWDKWLRPPAWCASCETEVRAVQWWKRPGNDMGRYRQQYLYRCPNAACRNAIVEPAVLPAAAAIDWSDLGTRIGDRSKPMKDATRARIAAGLRRYARPITLEAAGKTFERHPGVRTWPADAPLTTLHTTPSKALACPPLLVPAGGTWRSEAAPGDGPFPARTTTENDGLAFPPMVVMFHRNQDARPASEPLSTVATSGAHHGLVCPPFVVVNRGGPDSHRTTEMGEHLPSLTAASNPFGLVVPDASMVMRNNTARGDQGQMSTPATEPLRTLTSAGHQSLVSWAHLLVPYYGNASTAQPVSQPAGTLSTRDRFGFATGSPEIDVDDVLFRMLKPPEIGRAMAFGDAYVVLGTQREKVRQYGNAVTPPVAEVLFSALVEAIGAADLECAGGRVA